MGAAPRKIIGLLLLAGLVAACGPIAFLSSLEGKEDTAPSFPEGGAENRETPEAGWVFEVVDSGGEVGRFTSLSLDTIGTPYISYYDISNCDLKYAYRSGSSWQTGVVDGAGCVGSYTSLALDPAKALHISYYDFTWGRLKYARYDGMLWQTATVDDADYVGRYTSLALDPAGRPHIAYACNMDQPYPLPLSSDTDLNRPDSTMDLCHAWYDDSAWQIELVASDIGRYGGHTSLALDAASAPQISYYDSGPGDLKYASYVQAGGNCGPANTWQCDTVDSVGSVGLYTSLALDEADAPHISYFDSGLGELRYASYVQAGGNCGPANTWQCDTVDADEYVGAETSLALDRSGRPHISYALYRDTYHHDLKYAHFVGAGGNCGPADTWQCSTVDAVGGYTSLALDVYDLPHISYHTGWPDYDLKYAYVPCIAPVEAHIAGPAVLLVGASGTYSATYAPFDATLPVTFTWDNGTTGPAASYSWATPGLHAIAVTATNRCGEAQGVLTVTVCQPVEQVAVNGPAFLSTWETGVYTATSAPLTATLPVTLSWDNGTVGPTAAYSWTVPGLHPITVTAANLCSLVSGTLDVDVCQPVAGIDVVGPRVVFFSQTVTYVAGVLPVTATLPVTFTWDNGTVGPTTAYSWTVAGHYTLALTATNRCGMARETAAITVTDCWPVGGVQVAGPLAMPAGIGGLYTATALPITTSLPVTFTWDNGAIGAGASYSWTLPGTHTLAVTASNYCGEAHGEYTVTVFCQELTGVGITGSLSLPLGESGRYTATYAPITASLPLAFAWDSGTTGATALYSWTLPGDYTVTVSATNLCSQGHAAFSVEVQCRPVETVTVSGPSALLVHEVATYTAAYAPPTASLPLALRWNSGALGPVAIYSWTTPATYTLVVTATNLCGEIGGELVVVVRPVEYQIYLPLVQRR